jgi:5-methylcytosine-specific restriction endonuclease McrA
MAWSTASQSARASRLPADWSTRRVRVLRRDGYKCQARDSLGVMCGAPANQVDHIQHGDNHELDNLQSLCRWHHARKSSAEGAAARRPRPRQRREPEPHPGMIPSPEL